MAKIHDKFEIELAEVIKGYGNNPDVNDPFRLAEFYRFYELPNIAVSRENFEKMRPVEPEPCEDAVRAAYKHGKSKGVKKGLGMSKPEQRWIPVTLETLPNPNSVVVVFGKKGTWDYGTYRGWYGDIHSWQWKKNTIKHVYWWMYKTDALPEPHREE